jgi:hypothetical protein
LKGEAAGCVAGAVAEVDGVVTGLDEEVKEKGLEGEFWAWSDCCCVEAEKLNRPDWEGTDVEGAP